MLILSVDSSASPASVCLSEDGKIIADYYLNTGFTHSQTLMAMVESALKISGVSVNDIDLFAVNNGPGSFTGVRIGVSAVKGMAYAADKPCVGVSTLESMAYNFLGNHAAVCACMDARRSQVYNALFGVEGKEIARLYDDEAVSIDDLLIRIGLNLGETILVGDGAELVYEKTKNNKTGSFENIVLAPEHLRYQRASSTAAAALEKYKRGEIVSPAALMPTYLRLSQAERERNAKLNQTTND